MAKAKPPNAGKGRKAGTPNKFTGTVREAVIAAFDKLGGVAFLVKLGKNDPVEFARLLGRLLPREVQVNRTATDAAPAKLSDPKVMAAALALDEAVDALSDPNSAGPADAPASPVREVPPRPTGEPGQAADAATVPAEREAVPSADDPNAPAAR